MFFNTLYNNYSPFNNYSNFAYRNQPRQESFYRNDTYSIIINRLLNDINNYFCFDCHKKTNIIKYIDIKNGIFLCYDCALRHTRLSNEVAEVITGDINSLNEKYLLLLYYGGNKNLIEFIRIYFPLLERIEKDKMYSTKAMNYYRKLLRSKAYNEEQPCMPNRLEGYNSIFQNKEINYTNIRRNDRDVMNIDNENDNLYNSKIGGNCLFNNNENRTRKNEPVVLNNKNHNKENEDIEMKDDSSQKSEDSTYDEAEGIIENKNNTINNKNGYNKKEYKKQNNINTRQKSPTINQLGELSMYHEAQEIEGMD